MALEEARCKRKKLGRNRAKAAQPRPVHHSQHAAQGRRGSQAASVARRVLLLRRGGGVQGPRHVQRAAVNREVGKGAPLAEEEGGWGEVFEADGGCGGEVGEQQGKGGAGGAGGGRGGGKGEQKNSVG